MQLAPAVVQAGAQPYAENPMGASLCIVLLPKASGKPWRCTGLARGVTFGTMGRNRAAHPLQGSRRHTQPPGPLDPLFSSVLSSGDTRAEGEGFEPSWANAHPPPRPPPKEGPERGWDIRPRLPPGHQDGSR